MKLNITFVTAGLPFHGRSLEEGSLGGSESALLQLAQALGPKGRGHDVKVFCECPQPGDYEGIAYLHNRQYMQYSLSAKPDILVGSRWPEYLTLPTEAGWRVLWLHDMPTDKQRLMGNAHLLDEIYVLSEFHRQSYIDHTPEIEPLLWQTRNGIDLRLIRESTKGVQRNPKQLIYTSRPERGLPFLLDHILPKLLEHDPELTLAFCSYDVSTLGVPEESKEADKYCFDLAKRYPRNVRNLGHLTKRELYRELVSSQALLYPTRFPEISPVHGDTLIETLHGRVPIRHLVGKKDFHVYSCGADGKLSISSVRGVFLTRKNTPLVKLTFRPGIGCNAKKESTLYLTPDHEVMLRDGTYCPAGELRPGNRVKAFHRSHAEFGNFGNGYDGIGLTGEKYHPEHHFVVRTLLSRTLGLGEVVDHLDGDTSNNYISNLEVKTQSEHLSQHWARLSPEEYKKECDKRREGFNRYMDRIGRDKISAIRSARAKAMWANRKKLSNHVIVSVEDGSSADAYCMVVEPDHNFIANGIVVHNCLSALEAQACGCPVVTTYGFALKETIGPNSGILVAGGEPQGEDYTTLFVDATRKLLTDAGFHRRMSSGPHWVRSQGYTWAKIAEEWETHWLEQVESRWGQNSQAIVRNLVRQQDLIVAAALDRSGEVAKTEPLLKSLEEGFNQEEPRESNAHRFKAQMPRFQRVITQMASLGFKPRNLLDACCGDTPFGLVLKKALFSCEVSLLDRSNEVCSRLERDAAQSRLPVQVLIGNFLRTKHTGQWHCVFLGNTVDRVVDERAYLLNALDMLADDGLLIFTTEYGPQSGKLDLDRPARFWNFDIHDFASMFQHIGYTATFLEGPMSDGGDPRGHWLVFVQKGTVLEDVNPNRKRLFTRPYQSLSFLMIAKDEEDDILRCLHRVEPICDEMIVVDTGSEDRTVELAESVLARVLSEPFDNFSQVRNFALDRCSGDWVLWLDADEVLVNGDHLRPYLYGRLYEGYILRQHHLCIDLQGTFDVPVRLFRRKPHYRFTGYVHEHVEDTSRGEFDQALSPTILITDVDIAHHGYTNERIRRGKCSSRNLDLLIRDLRDHPTRVLSRVLALRDYINIVKWRLGPRKITQVEPDSVEQRMLTQALYLFRRWVGDPRHKYHEVALPMYQDALKILGLSECPPAGFQEPPFEIEFLLRGGIGGLSDDHYDGQKRWFLDSREFAEFIDRKSGELMSKLGLNHATVVRTTGGNPELTDQDGGDSLEMLRMGLGVFDREAL